MILAIDVNNVLYTQYYALRNRLKGADPATSTLYGFFRSLISRIETNMMTLDYVFLAFDQGDCHWRKAIFPEYKGTRREYKSDKERKQKEEARAAVAEAADRLWEMRSFMPWFSLRVDGYEADDLIAKLRFYYPENELEIISSDKDFFQLLTNPNTHVYVPTKALRVSVGNWDTAFTIKDKTQGDFNVPLHNFLIFRTLVGDTSDEIPGVERCGEITAGRLCSRYPGVLTVDALTRDPLTILKDCGIKTAKSLSKRLKDRSTQDILERNFRLMSMEWAAQQTPNLTPETWTEPWETGRQRLWQALDGMPSLQQKFRTFDFVAQRLVNQLGATL